MHAHGATRDPQRQNVPFELLHRDQERRDEDALFQATREERYQHRRDRPEHGDNLCGDELEPDPERVTAKGELGDGSAQGALYRAQQKPSLEVFSEGALVDV